MGEEQSDSDAIDRQLNLKTTWTPRGRISYTTVFGWFVSPIPRAENGSKTFSWQGVLVRAAVLLIVMTIGAVSQTWYCITYSDVSRAVLWPFQLVCGSGPRADSFPAEVASFAAVALPIVAFCGAMILPVCSKRTTLLTGLLWMGTFSVGCFIGSLLGAAWLKTQYIDSGRLPYGSYLANDIGFESRADYALMVPATIVVCCLLAVSIVMTMLTRAAKRQGRANAGLVSVVVSAVAAIVYVVLLYTGFDADTFSSNVSDESKAVLLPFVVLLLVFSILPGDINAVDVAITYGKDARWQWLAAFWLLAECVAAVAMTVVFVLGV